MAVVLDVFADILIKKLVNLAEEEVGMLLGVEDEVEKMKRKMEKITYLLQHAEQNDSSNESRFATNLVKELKDVMYEADDILDICMIQLRQQNIASVHSPFKCFSSCIRCLKYRHQIANAIQKLNIRMEEIIKEAGGQNTVLSVINNNNINPPSQRVVPDISFMSATLNIVGQAIEDNADKLIAGIVSNDEARCIIFAITGMGGIGKTTLASKIYSDERIDSSFQKRIWLRISKAYSVTNVLKELIRNLGGSHGKAQSREELETKLDAIQLPESLFLVLDDLWDSDVWYKLLKVHMNHTKCKILVTTRHDTVARSLLASIHHVGRMNKESCWELLRKEVFQDDREQDIRLLEPIGYKIVEKCDGLPLAVKAVAGILRTKERRSVEWEGVLASDIWTMTEINDEMPRALHLSYKDLSAQLKQCFLYCSFLAISGDMDKRDLMLYWIDEGFLMDGEHSSREDKAEECYRELILRNLLQPDPYYIDYAVCSMHDLLQSLGRFLIGGEAICIKEGKRVGVEASSNLFKVRRLSIISDSSEILTLHNDFNPEYLRAFFIDRCNLQTRVEVGLLERLCNLRILVLRGLNVQELPHSIGELLHLKHLDLNRSKITKIPDSIGNLGNLQSFTACECVSLRQLPVTITRLHNLRVFSVLDTPLTHVPKGIGELRNMNLIGGLVIGHSGDLIEEQENACQVHEIQNLTNLRSLGLQMLHRSRNGATTTLEDKKNLRHLVLSESVISHGEAPTLSEEQIRRCQEVYNYLSPPSCLEELQIINFPAVELPIWMMSTSLGDSFPNLTTLFISNAKSCGELPPDLCRLPELKNFIIEGNDSIVKIEPEFFESKWEIVAFPKLEYLSIEKFTKLEEWSSLKPSSLQLLPKLSWLSIGDCPKLKALPECLSLATNLKKLDISNCPSLVFMGNFPALHEFSLNTFDPYLPPWLSRLVLQPQFKKFTMDCEPTLFQSCLRDGQHWEIIEQIPDVLIQDVQSDKYMRYTKRNSGSYKTNVSEGN